MRSRRSHRTTNPRPRSTTTRTSRGPPDNSGAGSSRIRHIPMTIPLRAACVIGLVCLLFAPVISAAQPPVPESKPLTDAVAHIDAPTEIRLALIRLPLAAMFGLALALRPRRRNQGPRKVVVMQTQIMLAVVGAVIMLVVGNSLSRAFGIVGAAGLIRYRATIADPKDAVVMLCSLASGLAAGVGLYAMGAVATVMMMLLL